MADLLGIITHGRLIAEGNQQDIGGTGLRAPRVRWRDAFGVREVATEQPASLVASLSDGGEEAVDAVSRLRPAVVLMDLRRPFLDGASATARCWGG
ncbi:hypothetical protein [Pseudarthrobacter sp. AL20]|uniref:hypothetical protein n=1 Tax=unclassified Pseudarthrobacter TaxID=2647000 RepID=UPI0032B73040